MLNILCRDLTNGSQSEGRGPLGRIALLQGWIYLFIFLIRALTDLKLFLQELCFI